MNINFFKSHKIKIHRPIIWAVSLFLLLTITVLLVYADESTYNFVDVGPCGDVSSLSYGGDTYTTVEIGDQCWLKENLNIIPSDADNGDCSGGTKYCYDDTSSNCDTYGGLYKWADMMCGSGTCNGTDCSSASSAQCSTPVQGICPAGWHIPSHHEWTVLAKEVEDDNDNFPCDTSSTGYYGGDAGQNLKEDASEGHWGSDNGVCNSSGFTALPAGYRDAGGSYLSLGDYAHLWSSTESDSSGWGRYLYYVQTDVGRWIYDKDRGFSVRCLKDDGPGLAYEDSGASVFSGPDDTGTSEATGTDYDNIESDDGVRWETAGAANDGEYDSQLYKFFVSEDESSISQDMEKQSPVTTQPFMLMIMMEHNGFN